MLLAFCAGIFHDIWNAVRQAGKQVKDFWKKVVRFASIANLNHGPFRSGQWRRVIEEFHRLWSDTHTFQSEDFRVIARMQAQLRGLDCTTEEHYQREFNYILNLRCATEAGPVL